jgi:hypothetical protein
MAIPRGGHGTLLDPQVGRLFVLSSCTLQHFSLTLYVAFCACCLYFMAALAVCAHSRCMPQTLILLSGPAGGAGA